MAGVVLDHRVERNFARRLHRTGVDEFGFDGSHIRLSDEPAPISLAIRATCAVPGLLEAVEYRGRYLFDGALSPYGDNPVAFARKHLLGEEGLIVSCFSSGKDSRKNDMLMNLGRWLLCHTAAQVKTGDRKADININPHVSQLNALRFKMTEAQKQLGMLAGFNATIMALSKHSNMFQEGVKNLSCATDFATLLQLIRHLSN